MSHPRGSNTQAQDRADNAGWGGEAGMSTLDEASAVLHSASPSTDRTMLAWSAGVFRVRQCLGPRAEQLDLFTLTSAPEP